MPDDNPDLNQIDVEELARLALDLGNIDSPSGQEKPVAEFVEKWLHQAGFKTKVLALDPVLGDNPLVIKMRPPNIL